MSELLATLWPTRDLNLRPPTAATNALKSKHYAGCFFFSRYTKSGNEEIVTAITKWVFQEVGVLRVGKITHHKLGEKQPPEAYTVTDMVVCIFHIRKH